MQSNIKERIRIGDAVSAGTPTSTSVKSNLIHFTLDDGCPKLVLDENGKRLPFDQENILQSIKEVLASGQLSKTDENDFRMQVCAMFKLPTNLIDLPTQQLLDAAKEAGARPDPRSERSYEVSKTADLTSEEVESLASPFSKVENAEDTDEVGSTAHMAEKALLDDEEDEEEDGEGTEEVN